MIIDCHGHYTTSLPEHEAWRTAQAAAVKDGTPVPARPGITDDQIRSSIEGGQLRIQRERGTDLTILSPRAAGMGHHLSTAEANAAWSRECNDLTTGFARCSRAASLACASFRKRRAFRRATASRNCGGAWSSSASSAATSTPTPPGATEPTRRSRTGGGTRSTRRWWNSMCRP